MNRFLALVLATSFVGATQAHATPTVYGMNEAAAVAVNPGTTMGSKYDNNGWYGSTGSYRAMNGGGSPSMSSTTSSDPLSAARLGQAINELKRKYEGLRNLQVEISKLRKSIAAQQRALGPEPTSPYRRTRFDPEIPYSLRDMVKSNYDNWVTKKTALDVRHNELYKLQYKTKQAVRDDIATFRRVNGLVLARLTRKSSKR